MAEREFTEAREGAHEIAQVIVTDLQSVWRYPVFILGGLDQLGPIGALLGGATPLERLLPVLGGALFVFALMLPGGYVLPGLLRQTIAAFLATSLPVHSAVTLSLDIAQAREQYLAAQASDVLSDDERLAEYPNMGSVALGTYFLLISAVLFFRGESGGGR
jgi:hypothetical protein